MNNASECKKVSFTDLRHIRAGELGWFSPDGKRLPLIRPEEPPVFAHAKQDDVPYGIRLTSYPAQKTGPFKLPEEMSKCACSYQLLACEEGLYRWWSIHCSYPDGEDVGAYSDTVPTSREICCAESSDCINWKLVSSSVLDTPGLRGLDSTGFFIDPVAPENERYKAIYASRPPVEDETAIWNEYKKLHPRYQDTRAQPGLIFGIYAAVSPDGYKWRSVPKPILTGVFDSDFTVYYDFYLKKYVMYTRLFKQNRRWLARAESDDFWHWEQPDPIVWPGLDGSFSDDFYLNGRTEYPGMPDNHLMFSTIFHRSTERGSIQLYSSEDGICWNKLPGGPVLSSGEPGQWDSGWLYGLKGMVNFDGDKVAIPYCGIEHPHKYPRWKGLVESQQSYAMAWWPEGRISAVCADKEGQFFTGPMKSLGRQLKINARVDRSGYIKVGILQGADQFKDCRPIPGKSIEDCVSIVGDHHGALLQWRDSSDIGVAKGEPVVLQFKLHGAELFGFEWA